MTTGAASFDSDLHDGVLRLIANGDWRAAGIGHIDRALRDFEEDAVGRELVIDLSGVSRLDTAGAMVIQRIFRACDQRTGSSQIVGATDAQTSLLDQVAPHLAPCDIEPAHRNAFLMMVERLGRGAVDFYFSAVEILNFIGLVLTRCAGVIAQPRKFRAVSVVHHMEEAGLNAVPIVGLMAFLIGAVVAFMGAKILRLFNAEVFTVELVGIAVLREFGVLLAAILVAGRSGSAFTAQIGSMKIREEIDALQSLGLDPLDVLVVPRVFALLVMLPLLAFVGALMGMIGGGLVAWTAMDISPAFFVARTQEMISIENFWVGIIKAPFFAFVIAVVGCFQGMEVQGSAESLGQRTTLSVVQSLFLVIVLDAFFAMFFLEIDF